MNTYLMKWKSFVGLVALCTLFSLSSCVNIYEEISINKKGAGTYALGIDINPILSAINFILPTDGLSLDQVLSKLDLPDLSILDQFKELAGVHDVKLSYPKKYNYQLSMNFDNIDALNSIGLAGDNGMANKDQFILKKHTLSRTALDFDLKGSKLNQAKKYLELPLVKDVLKKTKFISTYHFPGQVKTVHNKNAVISGDGKTVVLENTMQDLIQKNSFNDISIKFKNK